MNTKIYIDDTGTPSFTSKSKYDSGDWKTWIAVIIPHDKIDKLKNVLSECFIKFNKQVGIKEFHFAEIYSGKGVYRKMQIEERLSLFREFVQIYRQFQFQIIVQSLTSDDIIRNKMGD